MAQFWRREAGGIYVEALVAVAVLAIALVPIIGGFAVTPAAQRQASQHAVALNLARGRLEALHGLSGAAWDGLADQTELVTLEGQAYSVETDVEDPRAEGLRDVRVTVRWTDARGLTDQVSLVTSVARRP
ncbi:MAG: type IV pilus modification PilV family protein [Bacillota bacterium]